METRFKSVGNTLDIRHCKGLTTIEISENSNDSKALKILLDANEVKELIKTLQNIIT